MKVAPFVVIMVAAALSLAAQPQPAPPRSDVVVVQITFATRDDLMKECVQPPTTVVVIGTQPYHCIGKRLISHAEEGTNPALQASWVQVSVGQRIRWESSNHAFRIAHIERHGTLVEGTPDCPFSGSNFPAKPAKTITSGPVVNLDGIKQQRYKVSFQIDNVGLVDPDFVCSM